MRPQDADTESRYNRDYHDKWQGGDRDCNIYITNDTDDYHLVVVDKGFEETLQPGNPYYRTDQNRWRSRQPPDWIDPKNGRGLNEGDLELMSDPGFGSKGFIVYKLVHRTYDQQEANPPSFRLEFANKWDPRNDEFRREHEYASDDPRETYLRAIPGDESVVAVDITKSDPGDGAITVRRIDL